MAIRTNDSVKTGRWKQYLLVSQLMGDPKGTLLRYLVILLLIVTGVFHLRAAFFAQLSQNQLSNMSAFSHSLTNPDALAKMARNEHLSNADLPSAHLLYKKALDNFVLHLPSWLGITEVLNDLGQENEAKAALEFIDTRFKKSEDITWSKILLASVLNQEEILTENLIWLANNYPKKKKEVFALATLSWEEPEVLMSKFGSAFYVDILQEYIKHDEFGKTMAVWDQMVKSGSIQQDAALKYVDYLLGQNAFSLATKVWSETVGPNEPLLYNGDFEKPILGSGFGWRISTPKGVSWKKGDYGTGLEITFDGSENVAFNLSQTLPLNPGKYIFNGTIETDDLTTDQLPFWTIQGVKCIGLSEKGQMVLPNQHVTEFVLPFVMPENCELVRIALIRRESYHFDNKIMGKVTVNKLNIRREDASGSIPSKTFEHIPGREDIIENQAHTTETNISINKLSVEQ